THHPATRCRSPRRHGRPERALHGGVRRVAEARAVPPAALEGQPDHEHHCARARGVPPAGGPDLRGIREYVTSPVQEDMVAARFSASGVLDATFGNGGQVITDFETRANAGYGV